MRLEILIKGVPIMVEGTYRSFNGKGIFRVKSYEIQDSLLDFLLEEMTEEELEKKIIFETLKNIEQ